MITIASLWLPILVAAVAVFVASSIMHMVLTYHRADYHALPNEERVLEAVGGANLTPGVYMYPYSSSMKEMGTPAMMEKFKRGPVGLLTALPAGPPTMPKLLTQWFVFCLVVGVFAAYVASRALGPGAPFMSVFRMVGTVGFLGYVGAEATNVIWRGQPWGTTAEPQGGGWRTARRGARFSAVPSFPVLAGGAP
ncbi:MAG: hypothetical protein ACREN5_10305 [Gemmatimonadales bacterium]